jgi:protein-glucosylgalactosylhydroxylysine glucosidase
MAFPLKQITDPKQVLRDLEYYETRVQAGGTPAMTQAIFSLLYSRLGNAEKAYEFFELSYIPNVLQPFSVMA